MKISNTIASIIVFASLLFFIFQLSPILSLILSFAIMIKLIWQVQKSEKSHEAIQKKLCSYQNKDRLYQKSIAIKNQELEEKYFIHELTHLPNKNALIDRLKSDEEHTLLLINIDAFKEINDFYGHLAGDSLIKQLGSFFTQMPLLYEHTLYHTHSDEFALLLNKLSQKESTLLIKDIERFVLKHTFYASMNQSILFTLTFGISFSHEKAPINHTLLKEATLALNFAKTHTNTWAIYENSFQDSNHYEENLYWLKKLKLAIEEDRVEPYFQPIVNYKTRKISSQEALIRIVEKNGVAISPDLFLEIAKKSKLYTTLTKIMIEKTFAKCEKTKTHFSINFSYEDMIDSEVLELLTLKLQKGTIGKRFTAEILESESIGNYDLVKNFIDTIKVYGAKVAIDDFGSGYSNFERLFKLDIDYIKIDGSIIKDIDENKQLRIITETIVNFAKKTNIKIIAEFVHSQEIVDILDKMGVKKMQGFYFSEPSKDIMITLPKEEPALVE